MAKVNVKFKTQEVLTIAIRLIILTSLISMLSGFGALAWIIVSLKDNQVVREQNLIFWICISMVMTTFFLALIFYKANRIANFISRDNSAISISGNSDSWIAPILQFMGISLLVVGVSAFGYGFVKNFQFSGTDYTDKKWVWDLVRDGIRALSGMILILKPKWIAGYMKKFSKK